jgi:hypothetical protein
LTSILAAPSTTAKKSRATTIPEDFAPTAHSLDWARQRGFDALDLPYQTERFINHFLGHGTTWVNWQRAWMNWILKAAHDDPKALNARTTTLSRPQTLSEIEQEIRDAGW